MRCLSCQQETPSTEAKLVMQVYLCRSCGALAEKAEKELELETSRALQLAKNTLAEHILRGGLLRPRESP
jgi:hypothetical protein